MLIQHQQHHHLPTLLQQQSAQEIAVRLPLAVEALVLVVRGNGMLMAVEQLRLDQDPV